MVSGAVRRLRPPPRSIGLGIACQRAAFSFSLSCDSGSGQRSISSGSILSPAKPARRLASCIHLLRSDPQTPRRSLGLTTELGLRAVASRGCDPWRSSADILRYFSASRSSLQSTRPNNSQDATAEHGEAGKEKGSKHLQEHGFEKSEKALKAAQVNMRARLSKESKTAEGRASFHEVWRLIKIARPEVRWLAIAFVLLLISSGVTMSIPFSVGRILDLSTKTGDEDVRLFGLTLPQFFLGLGVLLTVGAAANFGRILLLRIVGERVVARMRTRLFRRTYVQDAEFFDANRVGDLISRLNSDTVIVGKSITQNVSDGLRSVVSGTAGFVAMAWLSPKLTAIILFMVPPIALGAFFYGKRIRSLSRQIQKNVGTLVKIAEERLGNVKTSQAFVGEAQEIGRYSKQVKRIFALGRKEAMVSGIFFASTGWAGNMTILAMLVVGGNLVRSGTMTLGDLTSFMMYTVFAVGTLAIFQDSRVVADET